MTAVTKKKGREEDDGMGREGKGTRKRKKNRERKGEEG